ncbi:MAG TPA: hypothetical protein VJ998_07755, partial [Pseudomonadales bacterium]|nr:hypothetical protein [Pseudomonadales bacterium]
MNDMDMENAETTLANIAGAIDDGRYRKGMWQKFLRDAESLDFQSRHAIAGQVSEVSRKVHGLNGYLRAPFGVALALEVMLFAAGVWLLWWGTLI